MAQKFDSSSTALQILHGRDLSGKVVVVTGGSGGIGYETCRALAFHGAHVIIASRDMVKSKDAVERILSERVSSYCRSLLLFLFLSETVIIESGCLVFGFGII